MNITTAQIFIIGSAAITFVTGVAVTLHAADPTVIAQLGAATGIFWNAVGAALTKPSDQIAAVTRNIDDPQVKAAVVPAVSNLRGLNPLQVNAQADATLRQLAASDSPANQKIEPAN